MSQLKPAGLTLIGSASRSGYLLYECGCGKRKEIGPWAVRKGFVKSCGCWRDQAFGNRTRTHGASNTREHQAWMRMIGRCTNPNTAKWHRYGGRGIKVCARWRGPNGFKNFLADMGPRPSDKHQVDRFPDNNGNYKPTNCRWATSKQNNQNRSTNRMLTVNGRTQCLQEWANELGMSHTTIHGRIKKWGVHLALTTPKGQKPLGL